MALPALLGTVARGAGRMAAGAVARKTAGSGGSEDSTKPDVKKMGVFGRAAKKTSGFIAKATPKSITSSNDVTTDDPTKLLKIVAKMVTSMASGIDRQNNLEVEKMKAERENDLEGGSATLNQKSKEDGGAFKAGAKQIGMFTLALGGLIAATSDAFDGVIDKVTGVVDEIGTGFTDLLSGLKSLLPDWVTGGAEKAGEVVGDVVSETLGAAPANAAVISGGSGGFEDVKKLIRRGEAGSLGYEAVNGTGGRGMTGKQAFGKTLSSMSVREVRSQQKKYGAAGGGTGAAGAYQIIPKTLDLAMRPENQKIHGVSWSDRFDRATQERLADWLIAHKAGGGVKPGDSVQVATNKLAKEWASIGVATTTTRKGRRIERGQSYYRGVQGNQAHIKPQEIERALGDTSSRANMAGTPKPVRTSMTSVQTPVQRRMASPEAAQRPAALAAASMPTQVPVSGGTGSQAARPQVVSPNRDRSSDYGWYFDIMRA